MRKTLILCISISIVSISISALGSGSLVRPWYVTVAAGPRDRKENVAFFKMPAGLKAKSYTLVDDSGHRISVQVEPDGTAIFIAPDLKANATVRLRLEEQEPTVDGAGVQVSRDHDLLTISSNDRPVLTFHAGPGELPGSDIKPIFRRGGYIHPVFTPSGRSITDDYPADHYHHHGIWFAWTKTEFEGRHPDFWNVGDGTGKVEFVSLDRTWSGAVEAGFVSRNRYIDVSAPTPITVLNEEWKVTVYNVGRSGRGYRMFDLVATQNLATSSPLNLPEYRYGGIGFRGHRQWLEKNNCDFLTSEGKDRNNGHATRARWCHIGGKIDGQPSGMAILDHPDNFRAPQAMRINPDQPFFCYSPSLIGDWKIEPGKPYISRYRFVVYDGLPDRNEIDRLWNDYASPVQVSITQ